MSENKQKSYWIALHVNGNNVTYLESFGVECIFKKTKKLFAIETS